MPRHPKTLSDQGRTAVKNFLRASRLEGLSRSQAVEIAAEASGLSPTYLDGLLLPSPVAKRAEPELLRELWAEHKASPPDEAKASALVKSAALIEDGLRSAPEKFADILGGRVLAVDRAGAQLRALVQRPSRAPEWLDPMPLLLAVR